MKICLSRWCFMVLYGAVYLSKLRFLFQKSKFVCHTLSFFSLGNIKIGGKSTNFMILMSIMT